MHGDAALVEGEEDRLGLDAVDAEAHEVRAGTSSGSPKRSTPAHGGQRPRGEPVGQARAPRRPRVRAPPSASSAAAAPKPTMRGHVLDAAAPGPLLRAAHDERREPQPAPHEQRGRALRAAELVAGDRAQVGAEGGEVDGDVAGRRARVDVHDDAALARAARRSRPPPVCSVPTSWLASCTDTSAVSGRIASSTSSAVEPARAVDADRGDVGAVARGTRRAPPSARPRW